VRGIASFVTAAVLLVALAACAAPAPAGSTDSGGEDGWPGVLQKIDSEGRMPLEGALEAFATAIAPLPGVHAAPDPGAPVASGTAAIRWVAAHWPELTEEQRGAAAAVVPELAEEADPVPSGGASRDDGAAGLLGAETSVIPAGGRITDVELDRAAEQTGGYFAQALQKLGLGDPGWRPTVQRGEEKGSYGWAVPELTGCRVVVTTLFWQRPSWEQNFTLAHEAFHCAQRLVYLLDLKYMPSWIVEGGAMWAALELEPDAGRDRDLPVLWDEYLKYPEESLFSRSYDAFPVFLYLAQRGVDVWAGLAHAGTQNDRAFTDFMSQKDSLQNWSAGWFREPDLGAAWDMAGPGITATRPAALENAYPIENDDDEKLGAPAASTTQLTVAVGADILRITTDGPGLVRFGDGSESRLDAGAIVLCNRSDRCECPDGLEPSTPTRGQLPAGDVRVAAVAGSAHSTTRISGVSFECGDPAPDSTTPSVDPDPCAVGTWSLVSTETRAPENTTTLSVASGSSTLRVAPDGSSVMDYTSVVVHVDDTNNPYTDPLDTALPDQRVENTLHFDRATHRLLVSDPMALAPGAGVPVDGDIFYTCDRESLVWTRTDGVVALVWTWAKA
jgi:hypothetical protein